MNTQRKAAFAAALCTLAGMAITSPASAQTFVSTVTDASGNPFGTGAANYPKVAPNNQYQQYYAFTGGPVNISGVNFFSSVDSDAGTASYTFTAKLGTTTRAINDVSASFVSTAGFTTVFSGTVSRTLTADGSPDLNIMFTSPFVFAPAAGTNLLLDLTITSGTLTPAGTALFDAGFATDTNSIYYVAQESPNPPFGIRSGQSAPGGNTNDRAAFGLRTQFVTSPVAVVPEPSQTAALLVGGLGLLGMAAARRRRATINS